MVVTVDPESEAAHGRYVITLRRHLRRPGAGFLDRGQPLTVS